jgi:hypothetical protein
MTDSERVALRHTLPLPGENAGSFARISAWVGLIAAGARTLAYNRALFTRLTPETNVQMICMLVSMSQGDLDWAMLLKTAVLKVAPFP